MTRRRFVFLLVLALVGGSFLYQGFRAASGKPVGLADAIYLLKAGEYWRGGNFHDYGYFIWQSAIIDRLGSPWDQEPRDRAEREFSFPHTISVAHYLPSYFILLIPLSRLPYELGAQLWFLLSLASLLITVVFLTRWFLPAERPGLAAGIALLLLLWFYPISFNLGAGQNNLIVLGLIVLAGALLQRGWPAAAGLPLALAALCKIIPGVLFFPLLLRRNWRGFGSALVGFLLLNALTLAWFPPTVFLDCLQAIKYKMSTDAHCILSVSVYSLGWRLAGSKAVAGIVSNLVFLGAIVAGAWVTVRRREWAWGELLAFWSLVFMLGSAFLGESHLVYALPAIVCEIGAVLRGQSRGRWAPWLLAAAVALLGVNYHPDGLRLAFVWPFTFLLNLKLYGVVILYGLMLARFRPRHPQT